MANHSSILAWRIPRTEKPDGLESQGLKESDTTERLNSNNHRHSKQDVRVASTPTHSHW